METHHPPKAVEEKEDNSELPEKEVISEKWLLEKIDSLIPVSYTHLTLPTIVCV